MIQTPAAIAAPKGMSSVVQHHAALFVPSKAQLDK